MARYMLLINLVIVVTAVTRLQAGPIPTRGDSPIHGDEFLKIINPRPPPKDGTEGARGEDETPFSGNEGGGNIATVPPETSTSSTPSSISSFNSASISSSSSISNRRPLTESQRARALNIFPLTTSPNDLAAIANYGTKILADEDSSTLQNDSPLRQSTSQPNKNVDPSPSGRASQTKETNRKNDTDFFLDYDYYYYYMDDFLPFLEDMNDTVKETLSKVSSPSASNNARTRSKLTTPPVAVDEESKTVLQIFETSKQESDANNPSKASQRTITKNLTSTETPTTSKPSVTRSPFRYQTDSNIKSIPTDRLPTELKLKENSLSGAAGKSNEPLRQRPIDIESKPIKLLNTITTTEKSSGRQSDLSLVERTPSQRASLKAAVSETTTLRSSVSPLKPSNTTSIDKVQSQRNSTFRNFRYTTPLPKSNEVNEKVTAPDINENDNNHQTNLESASSSSVVVEVRVESPLPIRRPTAISQNRNRNTQKDTTASPRKVHTVSPDDRATSFLLSDSLVVDLASGPKTSESQTRRPPQHRQQSSQKPTSTTTVKPNLPVSLPLVQEEEKVDDNPKPIILTRDNGRAIDDKPHISQTEVKASVVEISESGVPITKTDQEVRERVKDTSPTSEKNSRDSRPTLTQSHSVTTSVRRTVTHTAAEVSRADPRKPINDQSSRSAKPTSSTTAKPSNLTVSANHTSDSSNTTLLINGTITSTPHGIAPQGLSPFGLSPGGLEPFGSAPGGLAPHGLHPTGLHPYGLSPYGLSLNNKTNATNSTKSTGLTFVDETVAEGANSSVGYLAVEHNRSRFRLEEKTADGFIIGEYGEVDHQTGDVNGVRYTADSTADPNLIYDALQKFLNL